MALGSEEMIKIMVGLQNGVEPPEDESDEARVFREGLQAEMKAMEEYAAGNGLPLVWEIPSDIPEPW